MTKTGNTMYYCNVFLCVTLKSVFININEGTMLCVDQAVESVLVEDDLLWGGLYR